MSANKYDEGIMGPLTLQSSINIIRPLSEIYIPPSNFNVQPFLALYNAKPCFIPDSKEVKLIIKPLLKDLLKMKTQLSLISIQNKEIRVPSYIIEGHVVWGATAMMISEFISLYNDIVNS